MADRTLHRILLFRKSGIILSVVCLLVLFYCVILLWNDGEKLLISTTWQDANMEVTTVTQPSENYTESTTKEETAETFSRKRYVYLIQSSQPRRDPLLVPNEERDVIWLTYNENVIKVKGVEMFTKLGTTWTTGRNALLEYIMENKIMRFKQPGYLYYIFLDEDMLDVFVGPNKWVEFERFLLEKRPSTAYISHGAPFMHQHINKKSNVTYGMFNVDANLIAFHKYTVGTLVPYNPTLDPVSIYFSAYINNMLSCALYASSRIGLNTIQINYKKQKHQPDTDEYIRNFHFGPVVKFMEQQFKAHSVMNTSFDVINCGRKSKKKKNFAGCDYVLCDGSQKVARIEDEWMLEHFNRNHTGTMFLLNWRRVYKEALEYVYRDSPHYIVDQPVAKCDTRPK